MGGETDREDINQMLSEAQSSEDVSSDGGSNKASTHRIRQWLKQHKRLAVFGVCFLLALLAVIPFTRHAIGGLFITRDATITVIDDQTNQPVSNASVVIRGSTLQTSAEGTVELKHTKPGNPEAEVSKQYYESASSRIKIDLLNRTYTQTIRLKPTGRAMALKVTNRFTGSGLAGVTIDAGVDRPQVAEAYDGAARRVRTR